MSNAKGELMLSAYQRELKSEVLGFRTTDEVYIREGWQLTTSI